MAAYILRRILLMIPTLFGIMVVSFVVVQFAPGGPVEQMVAQLTGQNVGMSTAAGMGGSSDNAVTVANPQQAKTAQRAAQSGDSTYRGAQGLRPEILERIKKQFGFDKPPLERFITMMGNYLRFDFGESYFRDIPVIDLIKEKLPVSITLGLWMTLLGYGVSIPLGIMKAVRDGSRFDVWSSSIVIIGYALPGFLVAVLLIVLFAGGSFWNIFPLRGLVSSNWESLSWPDRILDYLWHITLPLIAMAMGGFATTTLLTKNSFLEEVRRQYVVTARAKGLSERQVLFRHVFRNTMLLVIAGFPAAFIGAFFGGSILIETIFSLDGLGLLGFASVVQRDYAVVFATLYVFSLSGLVIGLISDLTYMWVDPRIDFESRSS